MEELTQPYQSGHLIVAAWRLFTYRNARSPSVKELAEMLNVSGEMCQHICNGLARLGVIELVESAFDQRVYLKDHLKLEELPKEDKGPLLEEELLKLKERKKQKEQQLEHMRRLQNAKKSELFQDLERKLKQKLTRRKNPLDDL